MYLTKDVLSVWTDEEEHLCRELCELEGTDPDRDCIGFNVRAERALEYAAWQYKLPQVRLVLAHCAKKEAETINTVLNGVKEWGRR